MTRYLLALSAVFVLVLTGCSQDPCECKFQDISDQEDLREANPLAWEDLLRYEDASVRARAARGAGRVRDAALADVVREALEAETDDEAATEQIFALGQIAAPSTIGILEEQTHNADPARRLRGVEALGKLGRIKALETLLAALSDEEAAVRGQAALSLARLIGRRADPNPDLVSSEIHQVSTQLAQYLEAHADDAEQHWRGVYAVANIAFPGREKLLLPALSATDYRSRLFAVRGIARTENSASLIREHFPALLEDANIFVAAAAADALEGQGAQAALAQAAARNQAPQDYHLRRAAILAAAPDAKLYEAAFADKSLAVRSAALLRSALTREYGTPVIAEWARSLLPLERVAAAAAATRLETRKARHLLGRLSRDPDPQVVAAALIGLEYPEELSDFAREMALERLSREDIAIRGTALTLLAKVGEAEDLDAVRAAYEAASTRENAETRIEAIKTATTLAGNAAIPLLEQALSDPSIAVRKVAANLFRKVAGQTFELPPLAENSTVEAIVGEDYFTAQPNPRILLKTTKGNIRLELFRDEAPRHVKNFLDFAKEGRYSGLPFHRVVTGFVIQGLDPRGDGWGTGGVVLRDEINREPYSRGSVGMPNSGPDTGGCQIFITQVPTPHLEGRYTLFGRVIEGMDVVDSIEVGDVCHGVEIE